MNNPIVAPNYEAREYEHCYLFRFNIPGFSKDKINIQIVDNELAVSVPRTGSDTFTCNFVFPRGIESERAKAVYGKGVLRILVPKREYSKHRQVQIDDEKAAGFIDRFLHPDEWKRYLEGPEVEHIGIALVGTHSTNLLESPCVQ